MPLFSGRSGGLARQGDSCEQALLHHQLAQPLEVVGQHAEGHIFFEPVQAFIRHPVGAAVLQLVNIRFHRTMLFAQSHKGFGTFLCFLLRRFLPFARHYHMLKILLQGLLCQNREKPSVKTNTIQKITYGSGQTMPAFVNSAGRLLMKLNFNGLYLIEKRIKPTLWQIKECCNGKRKCRQTQIQENPFF